MGNLRGLSGRQGAGPSSRARRPYTHRAIPDDAAHELANDLGILLPSDALVLARERNPELEIDFEETNTGTIARIPGEYTPFAVPDNAAFVRVSVLVVRHQGREARWKKEGFERWADVFARAGLL